MTAKTMLIYTNTNKGYEVREETLNGRDYIIVPVVMMVEGVHNGSRGPLLHLAEELGKIPESWNGIPVTVGHPMVEGVPVPANSPTIMEEWCVGIVFNTTMEGDKLRSEAWFEKAKLENHENLKDRINNGEVIEVSVGVYSEDEEVEGTWKGEQYIAVARNLRPEHLAILPNQTGACSTEDGCGIRINSKNMEVNEKNRLEILQQLKQEGFVINPLVVNETSLIEQVEKVRSKLYAMDSENAYYYMEDLYDTYLVYRKHDRTQDESLLYKQTYVFAADGSVEFVGNPVVVTKKVEYEAVVVNNMVGVKRTRKITNFKKEETMSDEKCTPCVKKKVDSLIANAAVKLTECDREWLETLEEVQLDKLFPEAKEDVAEPEITVNAFKATAKTQEEFIALMPEEMQINVRAALTSYENQKKTLVEQIVANTNGVWTKEELEVMDMTHLGKIAKTSGVGSPEPLQINYAGLGAGKVAQLATNESDEIPGMMPVGVK